jgi:4-carboxymuconolactone decarboxylase
VKEIIYQVVPYVGMGKAFDFLHATNDVLTERGSYPLKGSRPRLLTRGSRKG